MTYLATHFVPGDGLWAWSAPDPAASPVNSLDAGLDIQLLERHGGWAHVQCSNGWTCWVDGNALIPTAPMSAPAGPPAAPTAAYQSPSSPVSSRADVSLTAPIALVAGVAAVTSVFLPWFSFASSDLNALKVPLHFLVSTDSAPANDAKLNSVGALLLLAGLALVGLAFTGYRRARRTAGAVVGIVCVGYVMQLIRALHDVPGGPSVTSVLGVGVYVAAVSAALGYADIAKRTHHRNPQPRLAASA